MVDKTLPVPTINFDTGVLTAEALAAHFQGLAQFMRQTVSLLSGTGYGVYDLDNPGTDTGTVKPLWVQAQDQSVVAPTAYTVLPGIAVTPYGDVALVSTQQTVQLVDVSGGMNLVLVKYSLKDSGSKSLTTTNQLVSTGTVPVVEVVCVPEQTYLGYGYNERSRICVIAGIVYNALGNTTYMAPTQTRPWLRKWFSFNDIQHRSYIGSGTVTDTNPHGTSISDLSVGDIHFYDQFTGSGMVLSKDVSVAGVPGYFCLDPYTSTDVKTDYTGDVTSASFFGGTHVRYVELSAVPCQILSAYDTDTDLPISVDHIQGTKTVVLYLTQVPSNFYISYTKSVSGSILSTTANSISFGGITANEIMISNGLQVPKLSQTSFPVRRFSNIPRNFNVFLDQDGFLVGDPSVLVPVQVLAQAIDVELKPSGYVPASPVYIGVGLHGAGYDTNLSVTVEVVGVLVDGSEYTSTLIFNQTTYSDTVLPPALAENGQQVLFTSKSFASVSSIKVTGASSYGSGTTVLVYTKLDPARHRLALLASGYWNGRELRDVRDRRRVLPVVRDGVYGLTAITASAEVVVGANELLAGSGTNAATVQNYKHVALVCAEDFNEPRYLDSASVIWEGRSIIDCPVLDKDVRDSSRYRNCYRSRLLPLRKYESELCGFVVILNNVDSSTMQEGCVRVVMKNDGTDIVECVLKPLAGDFSGRMWIGYTSVNYRAASFVVTGRCSGFSAYFVNSANINIAYSVQSYARY